MASIYPNRKNGKIISFKFKAFIGRDENGKQVTRCTTWTPPKAMSEAKLQTLAEKEAAIWERQVVAEGIIQKEQRKPAQITLADFVQNEWLPSQMNGRERRASTVAFHTYMLKNILEYMGSKPIASITSRDIEAYLDYLKNTYKTKQGKPLAPKSVRHHFGTLNLIFAYAVKIDFLPANPLDKVETPKVYKHKVDALSKSEAALFVKEIETQPLNIRLMYTLLLTTGIRRGECFGLQ